MKTPKPAPPSSGKVAAAAPAVKAEEATVEISEDAVADYLLNIELDEEDKL